MQAQEGRTDWIQEAIHLDDDVIKKTLLKIPDTN